MFIKGEGLFGTKSSSPFDWRALALKKLSLRGVWLRGSQASFSHRQSLSKQALGRIWPILIKLNWQMPNFQSINQWYYRPHLPSSPPPKLMACTPPTQSLFWPCSGPGHHPPSVLCIIIYETTKHQELASVPGRLLDTPCINAEGMDEASKCTAAADVSSWASRMLWHLYYPLFPEHSVQSI
jgi:hypothetical protein